MSGLNPTATNSGAFGGAAVATSYLQHRLQEDSKFSDALLTLMWKFELHDSRLQGGFR
jgi:hypothetical protein